jgi:hypothetical protein
MISQDKFNEYHFDKDKLLELRRFVDEWTKFWLRAV